MAKTKKIDAGAPTKRRRTVVLPDDACPTCGTMMRRTDRSIAFPVNGERILVPGIPHRRCPKCGEAVLDLHESLTLSERAMTEYRTRHHLLSGQEILFKQGYDKGSQVGRTNHDFRVISVTSVVGILEELDDLTGYLCALTSGFGERMAVLSDDRVGAS